MSDDANNQRKEVICYVNTKRLFDEKPKRFFSCHCYEKFPLIKSSSKRIHVCETCYIYCHQSHDCLVEEFYDNEPICDCEVNNHKIGTIVSGNKNCKISDILKNMDIKIQMESPNNKNLCIGCGLLCVEEGEALISETGNFVKCQCKGVKCKYQSFAASALLKILQEKDQKGEYYRKWFNSDTILSKIMELEENYNIFVKPIENMISKENSNQKRQWFENDIFNKNKIYFKLFKFILKLQKKNIYSLCLKKKEYKSSFNIEINNEESIKKKEFIKKNQNFVGKIFEFLGQEKKIESDISHYNEFLSYLYFFLRIFIINNINKLSPLFDFKSEIENFTPFHRDLFKDSEENFLNKLMSCLCQDNENENKDFEHYKIFWHNIVNFDNITFEDKIKIGDLRLILQYLKISMLQMLLENETENEEEKEKKKVNFQKTFLKQNVIKISEIIIPKLLKIKDVEEDNKALFNEYEIKCYELKKKISKNIKKYFYMLFCYYNDETFLYLVQEDNSKNYAKKKKFFFDHVKIPLTLIKGIVSLDLPPKFYHLMLAQNDPYIKQLKYFINTKQKYTEGFTKLFDKEEKRTEKNEITIKNFFEEEELQNIFVFENLLSKLNNGEDINEIAKEIIDKENLFSTQFKNKDHNTFGQNNELKQVFAVELGLLNSLMSLYYIFNNNPYIIKNKPKIKTDENEIEEVNITGKILNKLKQFYNNTFIFPMFISHKALKILSQESTNGKRYFNIEQLSFYRDLFYSMKDLKCHYDFTEFLEIALNTPLNPERDEFDNENDEFEDDIEDEDEDEEKEYQMSDEAKERLDKINLLLVILKVMQKITTDSAKKTLNYSICKYLSKNNFQKYLTVKFYFAETNRTDKLNKMTVNILKLINSLHDYYYILFEKKIPIDDMTELLRQLFIRIYEGNQENNENEEKNKNISDKLKKKLFKLDNKTFRILIMAYTKYYIITPFVVSKKSLAYMSEILKFDDKEIEELNELKSKDKAVSQLFYDLTFKPDPEIMDEIIDENSYKNWNIKTFLRVKALMDINENEENYKLVDNEEKLQERTVDLNETNNTNNNKKEINEYNESDINNKTYYIFRNFYKFKSILNSALDFKNKKYIFKTFEQLIAIPSIFILYRILYFPPKINYHIKILTYKTVCLYLLCFKHFIDILIKLFEEDSDTYSKEKKNGPEEHGNIENGKKRKKNKNETKEKKETLKDVILQSFDLKCQHEHVKIFLQTISNTIEIDKEEIHKNPLNIQLLLKKFCKYSLILKKNNFLPTLEEMDKEEIFFIFKEEEQADEIQENKDKKGNKMKVKENEHDVAETLSEKIEDFIKSYNETKEGKDKKDKFKNILIRKFIKKNINNEHFLKNLHADMAKKLINCPTKSKDCEDYEFFNEEHLALFKSFNIINIANPDLFREYLLEEEQENYEKLIRYTIEHLKILFQFIFIDFHKLSNKKNLNKNKENDDKDENARNELFNALDHFNELLEFLRLLCENHNQHFQKFLALLEIDSFRYIDNIKNDNENQKVRIDMVRKVEVEDEERHSNLNFIYFLLEVLKLAQKNYQRYKSKINDIKYLKKNTYDYFYPLINKITEFLIEVIQGSKTAMLINYNNYHWKKYFDLATKALEQTSEISNKLFISEFLKFIVCYLEESAAPEKRKETIINIFNPQVIIQLLFDSTKGFYLEYKKQTTDNIAEETIKDRDFEDIEKNDLLMEIYKSLNNDDKFKNAKVYFKIAEMSIKFLILSNRAKKSSWLIKSINNEFKKLKYEQKDEIKNRDHYEKLKFYTLTFFNRIIREIEVRQESEYLELTDDNKEPNEEQNQIVKTLKTIHPKVLLLNENDYQEFKEKAPYNQENKKDSYFLDYLYINLKEKMEKLVKIESQDSGVFGGKFNLYQFDFTAFVRFLAYYSLGMNILNLIFWKYTEKNDPTGAVTLVMDQQNAVVIYVMEILYLLLTLIYIVEMINYEGEKEQQLKKKKIIEVHIFTKSSLLGKTKKFIRNIHEGVSNFWVYVKKSFELLKSGKFILFWNVFWGLLALLSEKLSFGYSLQLFSFFTINETMKTAVISVQKRYEQFLSASLLILILAFFFSVVKYYFFCDKTAEECQKLAFCFLSIMTGGVRAGGGFNLGMKEINEPNSIFEFLVEWLFYFSVILIMLNAVNGIIVDTFQEERENNNNKNEKRKNQCYICNAERTYSEKRGEKFDNHLNKDHYYVYYFQYLLTLLLENPQDLNSLDLWIRKQIEQRKIRFFPIIKNEGEDTD